ncbi:hypothetical protein RvY_02574 [Ramazzottius varieornatus]|uniref:Uncharacterized protein n=1 Tax=Ramazzottius varieornatus TaxID=947166 RepID=A0A1D1UNX8_RAMVA|nr:hypothetical protein RvY_02574 [Ramazzottius varieornatus]
MCGRCPWQSVSLESIYPSPPASIARTAKQNQLFSSTAERTPRDTRALTGSGACTHPPIDYRVVRDGYRTTH